MFLYRRATDVAGEKAAWSMEDKLMLPSGFRRDYVSEVVENILKFDQFTISGQKWEIGQEGRKLGSSLDMGVSGDRETIIAGAPFAEWSRQFPHIQSSGIPACMVVFVDKFDYEDKKIKSIGNAGKRWSIYINILCTLECIRPYAGVPSKPRCQSLGIPTILPKMMKNVSSQRSTSISLGINISLEWMTTH